MKRKKLLLLICALTALLLFACGIETPSESNDCEVSDNVTSSTVESSSQSHADPSTAESSTEISNSESSTDESSLDESSMQEESIPEEVVKKIDAYTTISKAGDKQIATVFDETFIADIKTRREQGEILCLSDEEIKYIIKNTLSLFETYDIVRVYDKDGVLRSYRGLKFIGSEEYFASFGIIGKQSDASFDTAGDITKMIFAQVEVLHTAIYEGADYGSNWLLVMPTVLSAKEWEDVQSAFRYIYEQDSKNEQLIARLKKFDCPAFYFDIDETRIEYIPLVSLGDRSKMIEIFGMSNLPSYVGVNKYDYNGRVVVVELYDNETQELLTRVRFDEQNNASELQTFFSLWDEFITSFDQVMDPVPKAKYRAGVYVIGANNYGARDWAYVYCPDGDLNRSELMASNVFLTTVFHQRGGGKLNEFLNEMIKNYFES